MNYAIKIGDRYLQWVDSHWYETTNEPIGLFKIPDEARSAIKQLKKHYVHNLQIMKFTNNVWKPYHESLKFIFSKKRSKTCK